MLFPFHNANGHEKSFFCRSLKLCLVFVFLFLQAPSTSSSDGLPSLVASRLRRLPADCRAFETYLNLLLSHPVIADDSTLVKFVTEPQAVPRVRLKKGE